jgi:hypothetical protein
VVPVDRLISWIGGQQAHPTVLVRQTHDSRLVLEQGDHQVAVLGAPPGDNDIVAIEDTVLDHRVARLRGPGRQLTTATVMGPAVSAAPNTAHSRRAELGSAASGTAVA